MQAYAEGFEIMHAKQGFVWTWNKSRKYGAMAVWCGPGYWI